LVDYPHLSGPTILLAIPGLLTIKPVHAVGETEHKIPGKSIGTGIGNIISIDRPVDIGILLQNVISCKPDKSIFLLKNSFFQ